MQIKKSILVGILSFIVLTSFCLQGKAQVITWSEHIAPIIYDKCSPCHHSQGAGHSDLTNYDTASYNAASIQYYVSQKRMPPWPPQISYKRYAHERVLSDNEINAIVNWVTNNKPLGDTNLLPPKPVYSGAALLTLTPDFSFVMPTYTIPNSLTSDLYWNFVIPLNNATEFSIKGFEFIPGNSEHVHHALIYIDTGQAITTLDNNTPGPGFPGFGGPGTNTAQLIGAYVPGAQPFLFPNGFGMKIPANAKLIFSMHYPQASAGGIDSSRINMFTATPSLVREVFYAPVLNHSTTMVNGPLYIPANTTRDFVQKYSVPVDISIFGVAPHMHLIGRSIKTFGVTTNGDTIKLINIPDWDFRWQGMYYFPRIEKLPISTMLWSEAHYDNTTSNPYNPNSPPLNVSLGEATTDEMMLTYFAYTVYQAGDENIILDSNAISLNTRQFGYKEVEFFPIYPNPANDKIMLKYYLRHASMATLELLDLNGTLLWKELRTGTSSYQTKELDISTFPKGIYFIRLTIDKKPYVQKFAVD